ncbi:MAG: hypothetical protein R6V10_01780, partial [bacterium]
MVKKKTVLKTLTRARLLELAAYFEVSGLSNKPKGDIIKTLSGLKSISTETLLQKLYLDELKAVCTEAGLDDTARSKKVLIERLTGEDFELT